jgi:hypothetical protein
MKTVMLRVVASSTFALFTGMGSSALADVWVSATDRLDKIAANGGQILSITSAFGLPVGGQKLYDNETLEIDPRDGSVWVYDLASPLPPPTPPEYYENVWRLLHFSRGGAPLLQVPVLDGLGLAIDHGRGGIWISRPEGRTDPHRSTFTRVPAELLLLDPASGAIRARIHGFRPIIVHITIGADGAIWVQHSAGLDYIWTRLTGTLAELDDYDISTAPSGLHHRNIDFDYEFSSAIAVNPSDGSVWLSRYTPPASGTLGTPEILKLSPEGLLLTRFRPRLVYIVTQLALDARNGSVWLADAPFAQTSEYGSHVAHYSMLGQELATAKHWDAIYDVAVDMMDRSTWAVIARELNSAQEGPQSLVKLDANEQPRPGIEFSYPRGVVQVAATSTMEIRVDIAPWDTKDRVDPHSTGNVTLAILSTPWFEATRVRSDTVRFGTSGAVSRAHWTSDRNGDGLLDLIQQFRMADTGIKCGDTQAGLTGKTTAGWQVHGAGRIQTIGCATP